MKKLFFDYLQELMRQDKRIYILFCGLGYPRVDEFIKEFPDRAFNTEASEQNSLDIAVGLAYEGKIPFVYTIAPFLLRGFETIRTYIHHENLPVVLIGAGRNEDYSVHDGFSHDAKDIKRILDTQEGIEQHYPNTEEELKAAINQAITKQGPSFISMRR